MEKRERRIIDSPFEVRDNADGTVGISGYAAVYDSPAHGEVIRSSAFNRSLAQRDNVRFLLNHEGVPLASTRAGTMTLSTDRVGLLFDIPSLDPSNPRAAELISARRRGDIHQCSFAMTATDDPLVDGVREVREAKLWDVSAVTFPWYEDTSFELTGNRKLDKQLVSLRSAPERQALIDAALRAAPPGKSSYGDLASELVEAIIARIAALSGADVWLWIDDLGDDWAVYSMFDGDDWDCYQISYAANGDGTFTLGEPFEVEAVTEYRPVTTADDPEGEPVEDDTQPRSYTPAEARALLGI